MKRFIIILLLFVVSACATWGTHPSKRSSEMDEELFTIRGEVLWLGVSPIVYPIPTTAYRGACGKRHADQILRLKKSRLWHQRLIDVAVWLEPVWEDMSPEDISNLKFGHGQGSPGTVIIEERECEFYPRMTVIPVGTQIEIVNDDRKDHWFVVDGQHRKRQQYVQYYGDTPSVFTLQTPGIHSVPQGMPISFLANRTDIWHIASGFHRWMDAWVVITNKAWYGKVDKKGYFTIVNVPRGVYRVNTWHPLLGANSSIIRVPEESRNTVSVNYKEDPYKFERISSSLVPSYGEVVEENTVWQDNEDW